MSAYDAFAPIYDEWAAHMTEDVPFYVELAREADGPLVELAVGDGRVASPVTRATGRTVIGIDSSPAMLARARERAAAAGVELDLRQGDMRDLDLEEPDDAPGDSRIDAAVFVGAQGAEPRTVSLWWCTRSGWEGLVDVAGLEVEALYGCFDRRPFDDSSEEFVWIARRPA